MSQLDHTLARLARPGTGLLVVDEYTDRAATPALITHALRGGEVDGVLLGERHLAAVPSERSGCVGVRVPLWGSESEAAEAVGAVVRRGVDAVELRWNRRPGQFPRGETHLAVGQLAAAASAAQGLGVLPVLTTAMPGLEASSLGVTRAVTVNALAELFDTARAHGVDLARVVLRTNLIAPGPRSQERCAPDVVAQATVDALAEVLPVEVPAVWFLSSGRPLATVCAELSEIATHPGPAWGFAMGRALLGSTPEAFDAAARTARHALTHPRRQAHDHVAAHH